MKKIFTLSLTLLLCAFVNNVVYAQSCTSDRTNIISMPKAKLGSYNIWNATFGDETYDEKILSGRALSDGQAVFFGTVTPAKTEQDKKTINNTSFIRFIDHRARKLSHSTPDIQNITAASSLLRHKDGFIIALDNVSDNGKSNIKITTFDQEGRVVKTQTLKDQDYNLNATGLMDSTAVPYKYVLSVRATHKKGMTAPHTQIYYLNDDGNIMDKKAFNTGAENTLLTIARDNNDAGGMLGGGFTKLGNGEASAWVLSLDNKGAIQWQRTYIRGTGAQISALAPYKNDTIIIAGYAKPARGNDIVQKTQSAWVAMIKKNTGDIVWQRYITSEQDYDTAGLKILDNGLIGVLLNTKNVSENASEPNFIRLITLNPRGYVISNETHQNAEGANAHGFIDGPRNGLLIYGETDVIHNIKDKNIDTNMSPKRSQDAWMIVSRPVPNYEDPCATQPKPNIQ